MKNRKKQTIKKKLKKYAHCRLQLQSNTYLSDKCCVNNHLASRNESLSWLTEGYWQLVNISQVGNTNNDTSQSY